MKAVGIEKAVGIKKDIDHLGRLQIPKEIRSLYCFDRRVELVVTEDGLLIRNPEYKLIRMDENEEK